MSETPVTAERPDDPVVSGHDHVTLVGSNEADTVAFYRDVLGLALVMRQPNLDRPEVTHLFFDAGDGRLVTFFVDESRDSHDGAQDPGVGAVHHVAFRVEAADIPAIRDRLRGAGHEFSEFDRGAFHALYTRDHNGLTIELASYQLFAVLGLLLAGFLYLWLAWRGFEYITAHLLQVVGLVLAAFIVLIFGLTVAKVTGGDMQMPSSEQVGATSDGNG